MATLEEQETTVTQLRNGDTNVYTANPVHLRALRKRVEEGRGEERKTWEDAAEFIFPHSEFDPLKGFKTRRKPLTDEQKEQRRAAFQRNVLGK
jgi:hypothetical protein